MSENLVTVTAQWTDGQGNYGTGNYEFIASGQLMDSPSIAIVTPVILGDLDTQGALSPQGGTPNSGIQLLASDNFGTGELLWNVKIQVQPGIDINVTGLAINYGTGATQGLFGILEAAGWVPPPNP